MERIIERIDKAKWSGTHWLLFGSTSVGFFLWGLITSIAPLAYENIQNIFFLVAPIVATLVGDLLLSYISDRIAGRKKMFIITMSLYGIGSFLVALSALLSGGHFTLPFLILLSAGIVLGIFGVEGEVPVMLSYLAENSPAKHRDKILILSPNFDNIGALAAAIIFFSVYYLTNSLEIELISVAITSLISLGVAIALRIKLPESIRWLVTKGKINEAEKESKNLQEDNNATINYNVSSVSFWKRYLFLVIIGVSQYLTYGLMAFYVADFFFKGVAYYLIMIMANLGASAGGFIAAYIVDKMLSKGFSLLSYVGGFITMLIIYLLAPYLGTYLMIFYTLLFLNMIFSEFGWAVRTIYEPTLMPNSLRAFLIGSIRAFPITLNAISVYITSTWSFNAFLAYNLALWGIGAAAAIWWYIEGININRAPLEITGGVKVRSG
ncbi:MAG: MFS transporter [Sulfolobaceae archaeon]|nr:MFS transporter [Sulfolobaceae archaeon]